MDLNNGNDNNGSDGQQQLRRSARIRKLIKMANEGKPTGGGGEVQPEPEECSSSKKNREDGNRNGLDLEPPAKKPRIDNPEVQGEIANSNELNLPKSKEQNDEASETSTTIVDLPSFRPLPLELNCEIFKCLKLPNQLNFIWGLGRGIYGMFGKKLLTKTKRSCSPDGNVWTRSIWEIITSEDGLNASNNTNGLQTVYAEKGFPIFVADCRTDDFPGTICSYYEGKILKLGELYACAVGLTNGEIPLGGLIGLLPNSYAICIPIPNPFGNFYQFRHAGQLNLIEFADGVIRPERKETGNIFGCGILMNPDNKLTIFFTQNGILIGRQFPIDPTVDYLIPTVTLWDNMSLEANFGDNPAKPFEYDIKKCPGMGLEWI